MITVPYADAVGHDPFEAAKPLLLLGWNAPAALAARVAVELCVQSLLTKAGIVSRSTRPTVGSMLIDLDRHRVIERRLADRLLRTVGELSEVGHGKPVSMLVAVELIEAVERHVVDLRQV